MRRGDCAGAMQYVPELTWILFLRILGEKGHREQEAEALGVPFRPSLKAPFRWRDWASPPRKLPAGKTPSTWRLLSLCRKCSVTPLSWPRSIANSGRGRKQRA